MEPGAMEEWQKNNSNNNRDHMIICWRLQNHVCKQIFRLYNFQSLMGDVLWNFSKTRWSHCHSPPISIYGFIIIPSVIHLPVLAVMDGNSNACLRPLLIHSILLYLFNYLFSTTNWVSWHQKGKPFWILMKQEMMG